MAFPLDVEDIDIVLNLTSGQVRKILGKRIDEDGLTSTQRVDKWMKIEAVEEVLLRIHKEFNYSINKIFEKWLDRYIKKLVSSTTITKKEEYIRKIGAIFNRYFPLKIFLLPGSDKKFIDPRFLKGINSYTDREGILFLQLKTFIPEDITYDEASTTLKNFYLNLSSTPGFFVYTRKSSVFLEVDRDRVEDTLDLILNRFKFTGVKLALLKASPYKKREKRVVESMASLKKALKEREGIRIFHLSDLHFEDTPENKKGEELLLKYIKKDLTSRNVFFVTGDLVDSAEIELLNRISKFKKKLKKISKTSSIYMVPGNHDVRIKGNISVTDPKYHSRLSEVIDHRKGVFYDRENEIIVVKVDSCAQGEFARGMVPSEDMESMERELLKYDKDIPRFLLLHHHPVPIFPNNYLTRLVNSKEFLEWTKRNNIHYILHGHKHKTRLFERDGVEIISAASALRDSEYIKYNILKYIPEKKRVVNIIHLSYRKDSRTSFLYEGHRPKEY